MTSDGAPAERGRKSWIGAASSRAPVLMGVEGGFAQVNPRARGDHAPARHAQGGRAAGPEAGDG